ncbi:MAG TPA: hypothetical protein V6C57_13535 [Coleofasciculaceae cyanobacterium]
MLISQLHHFLTDPVSKVPPSRTRFWLILSLTFAVLFAILGLQQGFRADYVVQDDARQHVFWMQRFLDPSLFPNDWIADYFQSIAPTGYSFFYRIPAALGINPLLFNKFLPLGLGLITTAYAFGICLELLPVPLAGFIGSLVLNQNLWVQDDLVSGTARAFLYPCFLAFLYYLLRGALWPCLAAILLQGLFYPQFVLIMAGTLVVRLVDWQAGKLRLTADRQTYLFSAAGLAVAVAVLLPYALDKSVYGAVITAAEARTMPEFAMKARSAFFTDDFWMFWIFGKRSGVFFWMMPLSVLALFLFPLLLGLRSRFPLASQLRHLGIFVQVGLASLGTFFAAHALLFRLYLPSRYTQYTVQILTAFAGALVVTLLVDQALGWAERKPVPLRQGLAIAFVLLWGVIVLFSPKLYLFPKTSYVKGTVSSLYEFFAQQPKDILVASLAKEVDNIPSFSQRSILVGREYALPYQQGYYRPIRQRITDLISAQYSLQASDVRNFVQKYGIDFWMIDRRYLSTLEVDEYAQIPIGDWLKQFKPESTQAAERMQQKQTFAIEKFIRKCTVAQEDDLVVLSGKCILGDR